jgi:hypothetical protein
MTQSQLMNLAIAGGVLFAAYKYGSAEIKTGAVAVAALIVAKRVPYVKDQLV